MIFIKSLWLETIMTPIFITFITKHVIQILLMYRVRKHWHWNVFEEIRSKRNKFPIQDVLLFLVKKTLGEANEILEQPIVLSSTLDELRNEQYLLETSEVDKVKRIIIPHRWPLRDYARMNAFE